LIRAANLTQSIRQIF